MIKALWISLIVLGIYSAVMSTLAFAQAKSANNEVLYYTAHASDVQGVSDKIDKAQGGIDALLESH